MSKKRYIECESHLLFPFVANIVLNMNEALRIEIENWNKNFNALQNELEHSPSDRSCVIVAAAFLDDELRFLLEVFLVASTNKNEDNALFSGIGPLSSFGNKTLLSRRLGLISQYEFRTLQIIRDIRNKFAHNISFNTLDGFRERLLSVAPPRQLLLIKEIPLPSPSGTEEPPLPIIPIIDESSPRDVFVKVVLCLANLLSARFSLAAKQKRETPNDYGSLMEIDDERIADLQKCSDNLDTILNLELESKELHRQIIAKLSTQISEDCSDEIKKHQSELEELEIDFEKRFEEYKEIDSLLTLHKYAQERIKKAFDEQLS